MRKLATAALLGFALVVSGCTGGSETASSQSSTIFEAVKALKGSVTKKPPLPTVTRQLLDGLTIPSLEIVVESRGFTAFLIPKATHKKEGQAEIVTWRTISNEHLLLQNGVLIGTRGMGNDLASTNAAVAQRAVRTRSATGGQRTMYVRNDVNGIDEMTLACKVANLGPETIEIVELTFPTTHLRETCANASGEFHNDYWVDRRHGTVWKSRQWIGPEIGYVRLRVLKR